MYGLDLVHEMEKAIIALSVFCNAPNLKNHNQGLLSLNMICWKLV